MRRERSKREELSEVSREQIDETYDKLWHHDGKVMDAEDRASCWPGLTIADLTLSIGI